ncbi:MAG: hypothetical protein HUU20_06785 [Pirellulales bacterium]|nr:hypothetical protein [Pirellulales bacterium]
MNLQFFRCAVPALVLCWARVCAAQQNPDGQLPVTSFREPYLFLIRDPIVHDDLGLNARQRQTVRALNDELDGPLWAMRNQSAERIVETTREATATAKARLSSILARDQQQRLDQVELWTLGTRAFVLGDLPERLKLSEEQRQKIREVVSKTDASIDELGKKLQSGGSRESVEKEARSLRTDEQKQILAVLTRRQQQQWIALLGKRIEVARLGRVQFKAPELRGNGPWINSAPLALEQLKGKVVALHFYAFG